MTTFINKTTGDILSVELSNLIGKCTSSLYIRKGFHTGNLYLAQRQNGTAGIVCHINANEVKINDLLFRRIKIYAAK